MNIADQNADGRESILAAVQSRLSALRGRAPLACGEALDERLRGRRVLITGAGGWIASHLIQQLEGAAGALILFEQDDSALQRACRRAPSAQPVLGSVRDVLAVNQAFDRARPDVVIHTAALKHVDLLELHPREGLLTNVIGSLNVFRAGARARAVLVNYSTDKAAEPYCVLGASKRLSERLLAGICADMGLDGVSVRLGNVLGSRGSVVEAFVDEALAGRPLKLTDPAMSRLCMTVDEAAGITGWLAGPAIRLGHCIAPVLGRALTVMEIAQTVAEIVGAEIAIEVCGRRPGERAQGVMVGPDETPWLLEEGADCTRLEVPPLSGQAIGKLTSAPLDTLAARLSQLCQASRTDESLKALA